MMTPSPKSDPGISIVDLYRLSVAQYHALAGAGILDEDAPIELLGGWLVRKLTQKPPHPIAVQQLREALATRLSQPWYVRTQAPHPQAGTRRSDGEPEPDLALVRGDRREVSYDVCQPGLRWNTDETDHSGLFDRA